MGHYTLSDSRAAYARRLDGLLDYFHWTPRVSLLVADPGPLCAGSLGLRNRGEYFLHSVVATV